MTRESPFKSPVHTRTGKPRKYEQRIGHNNGRFWWSCSYRWQNGQKGACGGGWGDSYEEAERMIFAHVAEYDDHQGGAR